MVYFTQDRLGDRGYIEDLRQPPTGTEKAAWAIEAVVVVALIGFIAYRAVRTIDKFFRNKAAMNEPELSDKEIARLRRMLPQYPGGDRLDINDEIERYRERTREKWHLKNERGMSNALAEAYLDRNGWPRPPGWHSVFFYPGSLRPRNVYMALAMIAGLAGWLFLIR